MVGAASGAADVAINTLAGRAGHATAKPLLTRSHGLFSVGVVIASPCTGALLGAGLALPAAFAATAALARLSLAPFSRSHPTAMLLGGGALATAGSVVLATAPSVPVAPPWAPRRSPRPSHRKKTAVFKPNGALHPT